MSTYAGNQGHITRSRLRSPRAAGISGILFSSLMLVSMVLANLSIPAIPSDFGAVWLKAEKDAFYWAISLVPIGGVAFLWFMGVARDLLGYLDDQFFSTVFTGSGLLFLAVMFVWAAIGATILVGYTETPEFLIDSSLYSFGRTLMQKLFSIHAMGMAGVYVFSSGSIWFRTQAVPRWLALITWGVAVSLWLASFLPWWIQLCFPAWVFLVSIYILYVNLRHPETDEDQD